MQTERAHPAAPAPVASPTGATLRGRSADDGRPARGRHLWISLVAGACGAWSILVLGTCYRQLWHALGRGFAGAWPEPAFVFGHLAAGSAKASAVRAGSSILAAAIVLSAACGLGGLA